jgi:general L-amino acid transport system substrate-binding protein
VPKVQKNGAALNLDQKWSYNIIKQVGNYAESYKRNLADTGIMPDRGPNGSFEIVSGRTM